MVIRVDSICGIPRGPTIITIGRFKLSEIGNMDQSPLAFEFLKAGLLLGKVIGQLLSKELQADGKRDSVRFRYMCLLMVLIVASLF
jgi:hypothetical protein